jgi:Uncharacterised nucleotidyltransferase
MQEAAEVITDALLSAALRGPVACPPKSAWPALLESADRQGVLPLLADAAAAARWDNELIAAMRPSVVAEGALAIVRERELRRVLSALADHCVTPVLLKGAHLAFALYPSPDRRPRLDTDLLIKESDRETVRRCLESLGYVPGTTVTGDVAFAQYQVWRIDESGARHTIDVHWRVANPKAFADRLTHDELLRDAVPVSRLGSNAFGPSPVHALLVACLHRTAHHGTSTRLVWLFDIHLLANQLSERAWVDLANLSRDRGLAAVVASGLEAASERIGTVIPTVITDRLRADAADTEADVLAFLSGPRPQMQVAVSDWKRIRSWRARVRFAREHLFPAPRYMRDRYQITSQAALPFLYAHRIATGSVRWLRDARLANPPGRQAASPDEGSSARPARRSS